MLVLEDSVQFELTVKNSRFLAEAFVVANAEAAREKLRNQKVRFSDASHVVHAFIVGPEGTVMGCSDDGEPSGTSGRPVREVLKGSGVTNVILTVTRWFGGTKLGTGGLVKAYTESAQGVVAQMKTHELVAMSRFETVVPYGLYEQVKKLLATHGAEVQSESFGEGVSLSGRLREAETAPLAVQLRDLSRGKVELQTEAEG